MQSHPLILGLETATLRGSVCLSRGITVLASRAGEAKTSHSNTLLKDIDEVLNEADLLLKDVTVFAAAAGPGSFTGLRIGLATTKALAATLERPCVGVPTLEAVAHAAGVSEATVALLPAGRGEVFAQLFSVSRDGEVTARDEPAHLPPTSLFQRYAFVRRILWAGEGAILHSQLILDHANIRAATLNENATGERDVSWTIASEEANLARHVALLALRQYQNTLAIQPESLRAIYVRPSDAELKVDVVND